MSSLTAWLGSAVLYRKLAMEEEVALGGRSWGGPLGAWPCRPQSRDPLVIRETPFSSTRAFESRPPSSSGLGKGGKDTQQLCAPVLWLRFFCSPSALPPQNTTACEVHRTGAIPHSTGGGADLGWGVMCPGPHGWATGKARPGPPPLCPSPPTVSFQLQLITPPPIVPLSFLARVLTVGLEH